MMIVDGKERVECDKHFTHLSVFTKTGWDGGQSIVVEIEVSQPCDVANCLRDACEVVADSIAD